MDVSQTAHKVAATASHQVTHAGCPDCLHHTDRRERVSPGGLPVPREMRDSFGVDPRCKTLWELARFANRQCRASHPRPRRSLQQRLHRIASNTTKQLGDSATVCGDHQEGHP